MTVKTILNLPIATSVNTSDIILVSQGGVTKQATVALVPGTTGSVSSVGGTAPISSTGGANPTISITAATTSVAGSMSAADKTKLDGVAPGATANAGTVTSVAMTVPAALTVSGSPVTSSGTFAITMTAGYTIPATASQTNWDTAYTDRNKWDGGATGLTAATGRTSLGATTVGGNLFTLTNPTAVTFPRFNADNTVSTLDAATFRTAIGAGTSSTSGTVTSVTMTVPTGLTIGGSPVTTSGTLALSMTAGYAIPTTASQTNWNTAYTDRNKWDGGATGLTAATGRTSLGATTVGGNMFTLVNPTAITFPRFNADNTVSALDAATFRTAIGAGTSSATGTVTSTSVVSANGFAGTVATASTTPAITISTSITGLLKGNGTAMSAATVRTDYAEPTTALATGLLKNTTTTGAHTIAVQADVTALLGAGSITNTMLANGAVANLSGTNSGDNAANTTYASDYRAANFVAGTNYQAPIGTISGLAKGNGANALTAATAADVTGQLLTGYVSGSGTVAATDTILQAINKLNGNDGLKANLASPTLTGQVSIVGTGALLPASTTMAAATGNTAALMVQSQGTGGTAGAAFMSFHRPSSYAAHIGIDTDNFWKVGGWSAGGVSYKIWHEGVDGAGSGMDSDLLDGQHGSYYQNASNITSGTLPANVIPSSLYSPGSTDGSYIGNGMYYSAANWRHLGTNSYGYALRNSGVTGAQLFVARTAGTLDSVATYASYTFAPSGRLTTPAEVIATGGFTAIAVASPGQPTGTPSTTGGTIAAGTHYARIVAIDVNGNATLPGTESAVVTTTGSTSSIVWSWGFVAGAVTYFVFVGPTGAQVNYFSTTATSYTQTTPSSSGTSQALSLYTMNSTGSVTVPGHIYAGGYIFSQYLNMTHAATSRTTDTTFYSSNDNYLRKNTSTGFKTSLALENVTNESKATMFSSPVFTGTARAAGLYIGPDSDLYLYESATDALSIRHGASGAYKYTTFLANGNLSITGGTLQVSSSTAVTNLNADLIDGYQLERLTASLRANRNISGGGTITVNASGYLIWSARYIVISNGNSSDFATAGYFDITCPTSGTVTGVGGAANVTATAAGIPLSAWQALYYIMPVGGAQTSIAANFRVASYTSALSTPPEWVLICLVNGDTSNVFNLPNGIALKVSESINTLTHDARNADLLDGQHGSYYAPIASPTFTGTVTATAFAGSGASLTGLTSGQITTALGYTPGNPGGVAVSVISTNTTAVSGTSYVLTANLDLTLPTSPSAGAQVKLSNRSGVITCRVLRNGQNIMNLAEDMTIDDLTASVSLVFADATRGWVLL